MASGRETRRKTKRNQKRQVPARRAEFKTEIARRRRRRHNLRIDARTTK